MKTMPRILTWTMRLGIEAMLTAIRYWEDRHADHTDYRMGHLTTGLWQASQSLRQIRSGQFEPMLRQSAWRAPSESAGLTDRYTAELFRDAPVPLRPFE